MKDNKLTELSDQQLLQNERTTKVVVFTFGGVLFVLFVSVVILTIRKGFSPLIITLLALLPILFTTIKSWQAMKKEIKARNL